jgi:hypothetical protein
VTVWLVYAVYATTNVVRETYLAISLGTRGSVRVDEFLGLHSDLFEIPGRGGYINNNPGASMLGAAAYLFVRPAIALAVALRPEIAQPKPPASYDDPRPNRTKFMNAARARGLDVTLGLAAIGIQVLLMAPLGALAALAVWRALTARLGDAREALAWTLVYAVATPLLFRSAFLNQNALMGHFVLGAFLLIGSRHSGVGNRGAAVDDPRSAIEGTRERHPFLVGVLLALGLLCDYSAVPFLVVFGLWILADGWRDRGVSGALRDGAIYVAGAAGPIALLLGYQWVAFGSPWFPAQRYMPPTEYSVKGWFGFTPPTLELLVGNLFDPRYGLFAFCPFLIVAFAAPFLRSRPEGPTNRELWWSFAAVGALLLFSSANQFANLQWNTGVRYMVPAVPLLFFAAVPVLRRMPRWVAGTLVAVSLLISLAVTMTREDVPTALRLLFTEGPTLPVLIVLRKMASGYTTFQLPAWSGLAVHVLLAGVLWAIWRRRDLADGGARAATNVGATA